MLKLGFFSDVELLRGQMVGKRISLIIHRLNVVRAIITFLPAVGVCRQPVILQNELGYLLGHLHQGFVAVCQFVIDKHSVSFPARTEKSRNTKKSEKPRKGALIPGGTDLPLQSAEVNMYLGPYS